MAFDLTDPDTPKIYNKSTPRTGIVIMDDYTGGEEPAHGSRRSDVPHSHHQRYQSTDSARHLRENRAHPSLSEFTQNKKTVERTFNTGGDFGCYYILGKLWAEFAEIFLTEPSML